MQLSLIISLVPVTKLLPLPPSHFVKLDPVDVSPLPAGLMLVSASRGSWRDVIKWEPDGGTFRAFSRVASFLRVKCVPLCVQSSCGPGPRTHFFLIGEPLPVASTFSPQRSETQLCGEPLFQVSQSFPGHLPSEVKGGLTAACRPNPARCLFLYCPSPKNGFCI